jgi:hypothetical protein
MFVWQYLSTYLRFSSLKNFLFDGSLSQYGVITQQPITEALLHNHPMKRYLDKRLEQRVHYTKKYAPPMAQ